MNGTQLIDDSFRQATDELLSFAASLPRESFTFRPSDIEDAWTIQEHLVHLADSEVNALLRLKTILAEPGKETFVINEDIWTRKIDAHREDVDEYLRLLESVRAIEFRLLRSIDYEAAGDLYVVHPKVPKLGLDTWVKWYGTGHFEFHKKLILRNLEKWNAEIMKREG